MFLFVCPPSRGGGPGGNVGVRGLGVGSQGVGLLGWRVIRDWGEGRSNGGVGWRWRRGSNK